MRIVRWTIIIFLALLGVSLIGVYTYLQRTLPGYDGEIRISGINDSVEILRDSYGMPHIYSQNNEDAYFALGYCMAQDRLFQMDLIRRAVRGRLSEILGEPVVSVDKLFKTITAGKAIEDAALELPPRIISALKRYAAGVNYFLDHHDGSLPVEFTILGYEPEPWEFTDGMASHYYMAWSLNYAFSHEMLHAAVIDRLGEKMARDIFPDYATGYPAIVPESLVPLNLLRTANLSKEVLGAEGIGGSNSWVISGKKSATGHPLLANDPHLGHGIPGTWYEAHLVTPSMNVSGSFLPGMPFAVIGANQSVAWGFTNVMTDDTDFYIEKIKPDDPYKYEYNGKWEDMTVKKEKIKVKGGRMLPITIRLTRHGPIIDDVNTYEKPKGTALSMRWTAYEKFQTAQAFYCLNTAKGIEDIEKAVEFFKCPGQNWVYADNKGNIGFWAAAAIPVRDGFSGALPVPGWDGSHEWKGYVPTEKQPHLRNPSQGWIATANNKHVGAGYPFLISHYYAMPDRFVRIQEMISKKGKLDVKDFERMQADDYVVLAGEWIPAMTEVLSKKKLSEKEEKALSALINWDFTAKPEETAPTIFHATINVMVKNTFQKRLGDELYDQYIKNNYTVFNTMRNLMALGKSDWFDDPDTPQVEGLDELITKSFKESVAYLEQKMGPDVTDWIWGKLHTLTLYHPFGRSSKLMGFFMNRGPFPMGGSIATLNPQPYRLSKPWEVYHGASLRYIIDLSERKNSLRVIPAGISGNFMSPHYDDQIDLWRKVKYRPFVLDKEEVRKETRYMLKMLPG